jgi:hypothetical protein
MDGELVVNKAPYVINYEVGCLDAFLALGIIKADAFASSIIAASK